MYYCFFCNEEHDGEPTEEHFIPRAIDAPASQWLPACSDMNTRSNDLFDKKARDILYFVRFKDTQELKRLGEAVLSSGCVKPFRFSYKENVTEKSVDSAFAYIFDRDTNARIPKNEVYAIRFLVGLSEVERDTFLRGVAKITLGALVFLLQREATPAADIKRLLAGELYSAIRHFALQLNWPGEEVPVKFSLGSRRLLDRLQTACSSSRHRNHVVQASIRESRVRVEGMLYSEYGWKIVLPNQARLPPATLRLENAIPSMPAPGILRDLVLSRNSICIVNPDFNGEPPELPESWQNQP